jgi:ubiquitin carboxyl-terminal hydrolase 30
MLIFIEFHSEYFFVLMMVMQGHISFPLTLDVSPFMTTRLGVNIQKDVQSLPSNLQYNQVNSLPNHSNLHSETRRIGFSSIYGESREKIDADALVDDVVVSSTSRQALLNEFPCSSSSENTHSNTQLQSIDKVGQNFLYIDAFILH